jgi:hypothetical protein
MIDISFDINGRKVSPGLIGDALARAALRSIQEQIVKKVGAIRDPRTGERPKIAVKGRGLKNLSFEVTGSERLIALVGQKLR